MTRSRKKHAQTLDSGFPLERPAVFLEWGSTEAEVLRMLDGAKVQRVVSGQLRVLCVALGGLSLQLELHFTPRIGGRLREVEILRHPSRRRRKGFEEVQARLVALLGPGVPAEQTVAAGPDGVQPWAWEQGSLRVRHDYYYEGALYEKVLVSQHQ